MTLALREHIQTAGGRAAGGGTGGGTDGGTGGRTGGRTVGGCCATCCGPDTEARGRKCRRPSEGGPVTRSLAVGRLRGLGRWHEGVIQASGSEENNENDCGDLGTGRHRSSIFCGGDGIASANESRAPASVPAKTRGMC
ncbi:MAG: hypothetical protein DWH74_02230 [Planctomycetota bacterium]|nr:MAG: hypothetical protein DWH74_02230 [Planctomycetota bacterium]